MRLLEKMYVISHDFGDYMNISFENILERDIDLLMIQQFSSGNLAFIKLFADKAGIDI